MFRIRFRGNQGLRAWEEVDELVWDPLGGRDNLVLMVGAWGFESYETTYLFGGQTAPQSICVRSAMVNYREAGGRLRRLRVTESKMTGTVSPHLVIVEIRPVPWTWEWLWWILDPKGDQDTRRHRSRFEPGRLDAIDKAKLLAFVEDVMSMRLDVW